MGCSSSKEGRPSKPGDPPPPQQPQHHVPRTCKGENGTELPLPEQILTPQDIYAVLQALSDSLLAQHQSLTLITTGAAADLLALKQPSSRNSIDLFAATLTPGQTTALQTALAHAVKRTSIPIWSNDTSQLNLSPATLSWVCTISSIPATRTVLFSTPSLTILLAPWRYIFISSATRLGTPAERPQDLDDAVRYLQRANALLGPTSVTPSRVWREQCGRYGRFGWSATSGRRLGEGYWKTFGVQGIRE